MHPAGKQHDRFTFTSLGLMLAMLLAAHLTPNKHAVADETQPRRIGVGDGAADDTVAIQQAVDSAVGDLHFTAGNYRITQPIVVDLANVGRTSIHGNGIARFTMEGPGPAFRFVGTHAGTAAPQTFRPRVWGRESSPMVDGIEIVGSHPEACGIEAQGTMQLTLTRVVVRNALHGVHLVERNRNVVLSECHFYDNTGVGVFMDQLNLHQINLTNCHISYNDGGGVVARQSEIRNLHIGTCDIEGNMGDPNSAPTANVLLDSSGSSIGEVAITGCTIQHTHDAPGSANIRIVGSSLPVCQTQELRHGHITIANNILSDVQINLDLVDVRGATITGNTMWKGYDRNVRIRGSKNIVMSGNLYDRNPRYHYGDGAQAQLGVQWLGCEDCTLSGEHLSGAVFGQASLSLKNCRRMNIHGCTILDYTTNGIHLENVSDSRLTDCLIHSDNAGSGQPIKVIAGNGNTIQ